MKDLNIKGFKMITMRDILKHERNDKISFGYSSSHFSIYRHPKKTSKKIEIYHFPKHRCISVRQQFDWINQVLGKTWMAGNGYHFCQAFSEAIEDWFDVKIDDKKWVKKENK
jgi:hypothetical protein